MPHAEARPCPFCSYDMTGTGDGRCPECGRPVERFTDDARAAFGVAHAIARADAARPRSAALQGPRRRIEPGDLVGGILSLESCIAQHALRHLEYDLDAIRTATVPPGFEIPTARFEPRASDVSDVVRRITNDAIRWAYEMGHDGVGTEHFLLGIVTNTMSAELRRIFGRPPARPEVLEVIERIRWP